MDPHNTYINCPTGLYSLVINWLLNPEPCYLFITYSQSWSLILCRKKLEIFTFFSAPSAPRNVRLLGVTDTTIQVSWWEPARANGLLQGYRIYFLHQVRYKNCIIVLYNVNVNAFFIFGAIRELHYTNLAQNLIPLPRHNTKMATLFTILSKS